ncbi:hypothetical protein PFISCL1PPCAC_3507, partial [Pristionchus fissidentatus]
MAKNCRLCSAHGSTVSPTFHSCPYTDCPCEKCRLIRKRRAVVAEQTRIRRMQNKVLRYSSTPSPASSSPSEPPQILSRPNMCQRCQNLG